MVGAGLRHRRRDREGDRGAVAAADQRQRTLLYGQVSGTHVDQAERVVAGKLIGKRGQVHVVQSERRLDRQQTAVGRRMVPGTRTINGSFSFSASILRARGSDRPVRRLSAARPCAGDDEPPPIRDFERRQKERPAAAKLDDAPLLREVLRSPRSTKARSARSLPTRPTVTVLSSAAPVGPGGALGFQSSGIQEGKFFRSSGRPKTADVSDSLASLPAFFKLTRTPEFLGSVFRFVIGFRCLRVGFGGGVCFGCLAWELGRHSRERAVRRAVGVVVAGRGTPPRESQPHAHPQHDHSSDDGGGLHGEGLPVDVRSALVVPLLGRPAQAS